MKKQSKEKNKSQNQTVGSEISVQVGGDNKGSINISTIGEKAIRGIINGVVKGLQQKNPPQEISAEETRSVEGILEALATSEEEEQRKVIEYLRQDKIPQAIERLEGLDKAYSKHSINNKHSIGVKLGLAAIWTFSDPNKSLKYLEEAIAISPQHYDANNFYASLLLRMDKVEEAKDIWHRMVSLSNSKQDKGWKGAFWGNLGLAYYHLGEVAKAVGYYEAALAISREIKDRQREGNNLGNLGVAYRHLREVKKAIKHFKEALAISREIKDRQGEGLDLGNLGLAYSDLEKVKKAIGYYEEALAISREIKNRQAEGVYLGHLGVAYSDLEK